MDENANAHGNDNSRNFVRPPQPLLIQEYKDMSAEWKLWKQQYKLFEVASRLNSDSNEIRVATLLSTIGHEALRLYNSFPGVSDAENCQSILDKFDRHFIPKVNLTFERFEFKKIMQKEDEKIDSLVGRLRQQAKLCGYEQFEESFIRDQLIYAINCDELRAKLLAEDIPLDRAIQICKVAETTQSQVQKMTQKLDVSYISKNQKKKPYDCKKCGLKHVFAKCTAFKHICKICNGKNHFEKMCDSNSKKTKKFESKENKKAVNQCQEESGSSDESVYELEISSIGSVNDKWSVKLEINKKQIQFKIDTGAQCNVLPYHILQNSGIGIKQSSVRKLVSFSKHKIVVLGEAEIYCKVPNKGFKRIKFQIVDKDIKPILYL